MVPEGLTAALWGVKGDRGGAVEERETFAAWARQERDDLSRFALLVTAHPVAATGVVGTVLTSLRRDFRDVAESGDPAAVARRRVVAEAQRLAAGADGLPADEALAPDSSLGPALGRAWQVWTRLLPSARACAALHVLDGLSVRETAWTLGLPDDAVRSHLELMLIDIAGLVDHRGRTTETTAKALPVLRELLAGLASRHMPVVEIPGPLAARGVMLQLGVLAAVLALVVAFVGGLPGPTTTTPAPTPSAARPTTTAASRVIVPPASGVPTWTGSGAPKVNALPGAADGWVWVSTRDVAIQVPASWRPSRRASVWGWLELSSDGGTCRDSSIPVVICAATTTAPMVAAQPYVPAAPVNGADVSNVLVREAGSVWLIAGVPRGGDRELVRTILASAVVIVEDVLGCPVRHNAALPWPAVARPTNPFDLRQLQRANWFVVCRYNREPPGIATLVSSEILYDGQRVDLVVAMLAAPPERPRCISPFPPERVAVLRTRVEGLPYEVFVYPNNCGENHLDDGFQRREVTPELCRVLGLPSGDPTRCGG